jgi:hypothetical protein
LDRGGQTIEVVGTLLRFTTGVALPTCVTEIEYSLAPGDVSHVSVGVSVVTVAPGCEDSPGVKPVGGGGAFARFTVKKTAGAAADKLGAASAITCHAYVAPFVSVGQTNDCVVLIWFGATFVCNTIVPG